MTAGETFQSNRELDIAGTDDILNLEVREFCVETKFLYDTGVLSRGKLRIILRFRTGHNHLTRRENKCRGFRFSNSHDYSRETLYK